MGGDHIKERIEDQVLDELEIKKLTPFQFDYKKSNVLLYKMLEEKKGIEMNEVMDTSLADNTNVKTVDR